MYTDHRIDVNAQYFEVLEAQLEQQRYQEVRDALDPRDVLAEVQHLMLGIGRDEEHPLFPLIQACVTRGTTNECGQRPYEAALVGEACLPLIERAIGRLVHAQLMVEVEDDAAAF